MENSAWCKLSLQHAEKGDCTTAWHYIGTLSQIGINAKPVATP